MNPVLGALARAKLASTFLHAGRSPATWKRITEGVASRVNVLRTRTDWITFLKRAKPRLREGPLLGRALEISTNRSISSTSSAEDPMLATRQRREKPEVPEIRRSDKRRRPPQREAFQRSGEYGLPAQVSRELLKEMTTTGRPIHRLNRASRQHSDMAARPSAMGMTTLPAEARGAVADLFIKRASRAVQGHATHPAELESMFPILSEQWSADLSGPTASLELLRAYGNEAGLTTAHHDGSNSSRSIYRGSPSANVDRGNGTRMAEPPHSSKFPGGNWSASAGANGPEPDLMKPTQAVFPPEPDEWPGSMLRNSTSNATAIGVSLPESGAVDMRRSGTLPRSPDLLPLQPAPIPRSGTAESASFDWNLSALAVAMQRILVEDARRHGVETEAQG